MDKDRHNAGKCQKEELGLGDRDQHNRIISEIYFLAG
jgi:hypothetical protein